MYLNRAEDLLKAFVLDFQTLYGDKNVTFNVHNLLHIVGDVRKFGPMDSFSAFRFENYIGKVKKLVRKGDKLLTQIHRRLSEIKVVNELMEMKNDRKVSLEKKIIDQITCSGVKYKIYRTEILYIIQKTKRTIVSH